MLKDEVQDLLDVIQNQNEIITKLSKRIEEVCPEKGYAMVNKNGEMIKCYVGEMHIHNEPYEYVYVDGRKTGCVVTKRMFEVYEI